MYKIIFNFNGFFLLFFVSAPLDPLDDIRRPVSILRLVVANALDVPASHVIMYRLD
jgi:hypothetical protein